MYNGDVKGTFSILHQFEYILQHADAIIDLGLVSREIWLSIFTSAFRSLGVCMYHLCNEDSLQKWEYVNIYKAYEGISADTVHVYHYL